MCQQLYQGFFQYYPILSSDALWVDAVFIPNLQMRPLGLGRLSDLTKVMEHGSAGTRVQIQPG